MQSVRKLPTRPKNVAQNSVLDDFCGSDRSEAAKAAPISGSAIVLRSFRTVCLIYAPAILDGKQNVGPDNSADERT